MFIVLFWAKNIVSKTVHTPLSPSCIWVHIIENENKDLKEEGLVQYGSQIIYNYRQNSEFV